VTNPTNWPTRMRDLSGLRITSGPCVHGGARSELIRDRLFMTMLTDNSLVSCRMYHYRPLSGNCFDSISPTKYVFNCRRVTQCQGSREVINRLTIALSHVVKVGRRSDLAVVTERVPNIRPNFGRILSLV